MQKRPFSSVNIFQNRYTAWIILTLSLLLTLFASFLTYSYSKKIAEQRFNFRVSEIKEAIEYRMLFYQQALQGGVGLFNSSQKITREEFHQYVDNLTIQQYLPGIQGIGYSIPVKKEDKEAHIQSIRAEGFPEYTIKPETERAEYSAIIFLEPFDWRNQRAFGYDMWSNEMRRQAMTRAMDTGLPATSGIITLVQETDKNTQRGFLMYLPVYEKNMPMNTVEERRKAFQGWVYSPFRAGDLISGIMGTTDLEYDFELYDGLELKEASMLFDSDTICHLLQEDHAPFFSKKDSLKVQGRDWILYVHTKPNTISRKEKTLSIWIAVFGLLIDLILFLVIYSLYTLQRKTNKLTNELRMQKVDLENVNKDLSQFAYIASHDLQEPLRTVSNYVKLIEEDYQDKLDEDGNYFIKTILTATDRMSALIHAILEYSKLGKNGDNTDIIDCNEIIAEIKSDMSTLIEENEVSINYHNLPQITGNKMMIKQLFSNLIANAIKYKKPDVNPVINIEAISNASFHEFKVQDNGIGMEEKHHERIFQIFQRLHNQSKYGGTGIGLSSCRKIVELHKGKIWVSSELNEGSTFYFTVAK